MMYCSEECRTRYEGSIAPRLDAMEQIVSDHAQRFDTLQTPWWKRLWFKVDGWPWYDLNGTRGSRPWHRR